MSILTLKNISYRYAGMETIVLNKISYAFETGRLYCITGVSGEGKTTLLSLIAGLDLCSSGGIYCEEQDIALINRDEYRSKKVGIIFQSYNLLQNATAVENVVLSMNVAGKQGKQITKDAYAILEKVGIEREKADRKILKLSGGEQQRVAIARAITNGSPILIADEPTGNLDADNEQAIMDIFKKLAHEENKCVIVVTHSKKVASEADVVLKLKKGELHIETNNCH
ncbi:MAG: ABC transporter ATP-binding protein [Lachnospiraceae bacterium]|nr:ABC transporter ATP-binding protein [Lachnospiraceae bacterium]